MNNLKIVKESGLHDYELVDIRVNYNKACVNILLKSPYGDDLEVSINNFVLFKISHKEEWGKGKYICASDIIYEKTLDIYILEIELNSGDQIIINFLNN